MKARCLSVSRRNEETNELIEEYADMWGMSTSGAVFHCIREYNRLMTNERLRQLEASR